MWHTFKNIQTTKYLYFVNNNGTLNYTVEVFPGNWTETALANYIQTKLNAWTANATTYSVTYDPYQLQFLFCPAVNITKESTLNKYIGFPEYTEILNANVSQFPPVLLRGPQCINVWTNFTMNNIPVSHFLASIPITVPYGYYIFHTNYDVSESVLCLDSHIDNVSIRLLDDYGNDLPYFDDLDWEIVLSLLPTIPEGFSPLES